MRLRISCPRILSPNTSLSEWILVFPSDAEPRGETGDSEVRVATWARNGRIPASNGPIFARAPVFFPVRVAGCSVDRFGALAWAPLACRSRCRSVAARGAARCAARAPFAPILALPKHRGSPLPLSAPLSRARLPLVCEPPTRSDSDARRAFPALDCGGFPGAQHIGPSVSFRSRRSIVCVRARVGHRHKVFDFVATSPTRLWDVAARTANSSGAKAYSKAAVATTSLVDANQSRNLDARSMESALREVCQDGMGGGAGRGGGDATRPFTTSPLCSPGFLRRAFLPGPGHHAACSVV